MGGRIYYVKAARGAAACGAAFLFLLRRGRGGRRSRGSTCRDLINVLPRVRRAAAGQRALALVG